MNPLGRPWCCFIAVLLSCSGILAWGPQKVYSVWLLPSGAQYDSLHALICGLSARYPSPCFMPHVTVVGDVPGTLEDIAYRTEKLARRTRLTVRQAPRQPRRATRYGDPAASCRSFHFVTSCTPALKRHGSAVGAARRCCGPLRSTLAIIRFNPGETPISPLLI